MASLIGAIVLVFVIGLVGANTGPGRALLTRLVPDLTGGTVHVVGLAGRLPGALRLQHVSISDASGTYLTAEDVVLDWEPLRLFDGKIVIDRLTAARAHLLRLPRKPKGNASYAPAHSAQPMPLVLHHLAVADLAIAPALAGRPDTTEPVALKVVASGARAANGRDALELEATPLQGGGRYRIEASLGPDKVSLIADIDEPDHGLLSGFAGLIVPGPIRITAHLAGPRSAVATRIEASLGPITAQASGRVDLAHRSADLKLTASAGAMELRPGIGWQSVALHGSLDGPFVTPTLRALIEIRDLAAAGANVANLTARLSGTAGEATLQAQLAGVTVPGPDPQLLAGAPIELHARMQLDATGRPLSFVVRHPLLEVRGEAADRHLAATITLPDLRPIAAILHEPLAGSAAMRLKANELPSGLAISSDGRLALSAAPPPALALLGPAATLQLAAEVRGGVAMISRISLSGAGISLDAHGHVSRKAASIEWQAKLPDLDLVRPGVNGALAAHGTIEGPTGAPVLAAELDGMLEGAPLSLALTATRVPFQVTLEQARWKSVHANGTITEGKGEIRFGVAHLGDFFAFSGQALAGSAEGALSAKIGSGGPHLDAHLRLDEIRYGKIKGAATLRATGPLDALALDINASASAPAPARLTAEALINATAGEASLAALTLDDHGLSARLLAPARIAFRPGLAIRGLKLAAAGAELDADGSLSPQLALNLSLRNLTPALISRFAPHLAIKGRLDAEAKLTGSLGAPTGRIKARATGLHLASGLAAGLPPADLTLDADIAGQRMQMRAALAVGSGARVALSGAAPIGGAGALDLGVNGHADLALLEPTMAVSGRHVAGELALDARIGGTLAAPAITGSAVLSGGSIADYQTGLALSRIGGRFAAAGGRVELRNVTAHAGAGTIVLSGSIGVLQPGMPLSLHLAAHDAEPLLSDRITIRLDSELQLTGFAERQLAVKGMLHVRRAEIAIPKSLPPGIAVLQVMRPGLNPPGARPQPPPEAAPNIALDVTLDAPRQIFVRGRGVDAEFGGRVHVSGTAAAPQAVGSLHLIRGAVSLAGQRLTFTSGTIGFNGGDPADPTLDLVATTSNRATTATLTLGGTVRKPTVTLSSVPELPQDQVLAALLFGGATSGLSPFQIAEMANALTSLTGTGPSVGDPLGTIRKTLGLDQLSVGSDTSGNPTLQAGRYIAPGVYVGASQSTSGGGAAAKVKIDLTKRLKLEATTGSGGGSATAIGGGSMPDQRNGSSIGLTYQFQY